MGPGGFEPPCGIPDLQSGAIDRSATSPLFGASPRTRTEKLLNLNQEGRPIPFNDALIGGASEDRTRGLSRDRGVF